MRIALPPSLNSFVGHADDLAEITRLFTPLPHGAAPLNGAHDRVRLVTLTGPAGIGKSRLGSQATGDLEKHYRDGGRVIPLAAVQDPALLITAIAEGLGVVPSPRHPPADSVASFLRDKQMLLLLDDFDPVIAAAPLVVELLAAAPNLTLLVTSREPLHLPGEQEYLVPPLDLPPLHPLPPLETLNQYAGIALFVQRARSVQPGFALTDDNASAVALICYGLDGLPLAIELAAARIKTLPVTQIADRLCDCLDLLTQGSRTAQPRHHTLRTALDWSFDLLTGPEQALLRRLSVFAGGFSLAGAEAVGAGGPVQGSAILDLVAALVDKSLVAVLPSSNEGRYRLLKTIRSYAQDELAAAGEAAATERRHFDFYDRMVQQGEAQLSAPGQEVWLARLKLEHHNLEVALRWCRENGEHQAEQRLTAALEAFGRLAPVDSRQQPSPQGAIPRDAASRAANIFGPSPAGAPGEPQLTIFTLGAGQVFRDGRALTMNDWTYGKARELLFYLVCHPSRSKEQIGLALWPDVSDAQLRNNFRVVLYHLRQALGRAEWIHFKDGSYGFNRSLPCWIDCQAFESRVAAARAALDADQAILDLQEAIALYREEFLTDLAVDWPVLHREELRRLYQGALLLLGKLLLAADRYAEAEPIYQRALDQDSYLEAAHRGMMRCLVHLGERGQALRHYDALVTLLAQDLGSQPARETVALGARLRRGEEP